MTANYSKGEWIPYQRKSNNISICVKSSDKEVVVLEVASLNTLLGYDTVLANALLISSAPAMYEALKAILNNCEFLGNESSLREAVEIKPTIELVEALQSAREALAKAEGRNA